MDSLCEGDAIIQARVWFKNMIVGPELFVRLTERETCTKFHGGIWGMVVVGVGGLGGWCCCYGRGKKCRRKKKKSNKKTKMVMMVNLADGS